VIGLALRFAIRNLRRHGRRALIIGLGIAVGVAAAVVHRGLVAGIRSQMIDHLVVAQYGHVAILPPLDAGPEGGEKFRRFLEDPDPIVELIRRELPRATVAPSLSTLGMAFGEQASTARIALWGIDAQQGAELLQTLLHRAGGDATLRRGSVFLGASLARRLEVQRGDPVTLSVLDPHGDFDAVDYQVASVLERGAPWQDYFVYLVLEDLQEMMGAPDTVTMLKLYLPGGLRQADAAVAQLRPTLPDGIQVGTYRETGELYMGIIAASRVQAMMIDIVLLLAVAFAVAGAQILSVHERQREFGTMTALGTSRSVIRTMVLSEGALLSLVAGGVGAVLGAAVTLALGGSGVGMDAEAFAWMVGGPRVLPRVDVAAMGWTLLQLVVVVTLSGLYPAARAARLLPVEALSGGSA